VHPGPGLAVSVGAVVRLAGAVQARELDVVADDARLRPAGSEVQRLLSDPAHAKQLLGWSPEVSLEEGLRRTAAWLEGARGWFRLPGYAV
jgi:nucleoside-diphosphate-sugar epimerase